MLEVHGMENARRSNNARAFKNVRGNTHATNITLARSETRARIFVTNGVVVVGRDVRSSLVATDPTARRPMGGLASKNVLGNRPKP
jgi:hypothetical protein